MMVLDCHDDFSLWRSQARILLSHGFEPAQLCWQQGPIGDLLAQEALLPEQTGPFIAKVPAPLLILLKSASSYRGEQRWNLLYEVLWRVAHGDRAAMLVGDPLGSELHRRIKQVRREIHHVHAFVRFIPLAPELAEQNGVDMVAYHEPAHDVLLAASSHFAERLGKTRWLIASDVDGVCYDGQFNYQKQCPTLWQQLAKHADDPDAELWRTYYRSIFNPARVNPQVLRQQMPGRFWQYLPEGNLIAPLVGQARLGKQRDGQAVEVAAKAGKRLRLTAGQLRAGHP